MNLRVPTSATLIVLLFCSVAILRGEDDRIRIEERYLSDIPAYEEAVEAKVAGVEAIYFDGPEFQGKPSRVFAFYGCPDVQPGQKVPAIILIHGGNGTAFPEWVKLWVDRGYAAIALDLFGNVPLPDGQRVPVKGGGPIGGPSFVHLDDPLPDQWPYYAENAIARARTLLGSFPEIDAERIGITGISWGGYLSSMAVALDHRYRFAIHVYGCGFLKEQSIWSEILNEPGVARWNQTFDPSLYIGETKTPVLWISGTNDPAYGLESLIKSYQLIRKAPVTLLVTVGMPHGHPEGWAPPEIKAFADSYCLGGIPLPKVSEISTKEEQLIAEYETEIPIANASLIFTRRSDANWKDRLWSNLPATVHADSQTISAERPTKTMLSFFNVTDERGLTVSSPILVVPAEQ